MVLGVEEGDTEVEADKTLEKLLKLRLFPNEEGKLDFSIEEEGRALVVSHLPCADTKKGRALILRPLWIRTCKKTLCYFIERAKHRCLSVQSGRFEV